MTVQELIQVSRTTRSNWWPRLLAMFKAGAPPEPEFPGLLDTAAFSRALHREWSRSQRLGLPLALVLIADSLAADANPLREQGLLALALALRDRIRCTDIIGWHHPGKLGILLAHTSGEAAWRLAADIQARLDRTPGLAEAVCIEVFAWPDSGTQHNGCAAL